MAEHSFRTLMQRLSNAGFKRQFVSTALLPDWWDESYAQDAEVLSEIDIRVARFLESPLSVVRDVEAALPPPAYGGARLRRVRDIDSDRLAPAIHAAIGVARAVIRNLRNPQPVEFPPTDAFEWRRRLQAGESAPVQLEDILNNLWSKGVPVIPLDEVPAPSFQGLACVVDDHPVIALGQRYDAPGRVAFVVAHETGHIAAGDCSSNVPVVDEDEDVQDGSPMERKADLFATRLLMGKDTVAIPEEEGLGAKELAQTAVDLEEEIGADASWIIYAWAARTLDYPTAGMAVKALYRAAGARRRLRKIFDQYVDLDSAGESDRALLRCVYGEPQPTALAG